MRNMLCKDGVKEGNTLALICVPVNAAALAHVVRRVSRTVLARKPCFTGYFKGAPYNERY